MSDSFSKSVLIAPYYFRSGSWNSGTEYRRQRDAGFTSGNAERIELFAGSVLPTMVVYLRRVGQQQLVGGRGDFFGYVSRCKDGVEGTVHCSRNRSATQRIIGHLGRPTELSWIAPAPWNYAPRGQMMD